VRPLSAYHDAIAGNGSSGRGGEEGFTGRVAIACFYWAKKKVSTTTVSEVVGGIRIYKKKVHKEERPRSE
jgi:hypothetical protein